MRKVNQEENYYDYLERKYHSNEVKEFSLGKKILLVLVASSIGFAGFHLIKNAVTNVSAKEAVVTTVEEPDEVYEVIPTMEPVVETIAPFEKPTATPMVTPEPTPVSYDNGYNRGDTVVSNADVNLRLNTTKKSNKIGVLPKGSVVDRILTDGDWDLIRYGDQIAYVHADYTDESEVDYNHEYYRIEEYSDIARTTSKLYFRLGPSKSEPDMFLLNKDEEVVVIAKAIPYDNPDDVWYLVRARGQIGYINAGYTKSLRKSLEASGVYMEDVKIQQLGYLKDNTTVLNENGNPSKTLDSYQLVEVLQAHGDYSLIVCDGVVGYVPSNSIKKLNGTFLTVDLSSQRISYYINNDLVFQGKCTTGKKSSPTEIGCFKPYGKSSSHDFGHDNYAAKILWMPFNGGQGLHDAPWESNSKFGDPSYTKSHGSAGCVRLPDDVAAYVHENVSKDTTVLVKK